MQKIFITTLGCKVNQADSGELAANLIAAGNEIVKKPECADVCILNTCTVTAKADMECRRMARRLRAQNPKAKIVLTGCYVNVSADELKKMAEVDEIVKNNELVAYFKIPPSPPFSKGGEGGSRARPHLKIQDGCNNFCAYCIVPYARGRSRSVPLEDVIARVEALVTTGYREVVFTGIHLGGYGQDLQPKRNLLQLLCSPGLQAGSIARSKDRDYKNFRIRLSSIDPDEWTDELIDLIAENKSICRHFHIPLQSGDDEILRKMGRKYTTERYRSIIENIILKMPDCAIGSDVITGFPGESPAHFERTRAFLSVLPISYLHVFPYSKRKPTAASKLKETATNREKQERAEILRVISMKKRYGFYEKQIGRTLEVVVLHERDKKSGKLKGIAENYVPVVFDGDSGLMGNMINILVVQAEKEYVMGRGYDDINR